MISPFPERRELLEPTTTRHDAHEPTQTLYNVLGQLKQQIVRHPTQSLLVALSAGVAIGWITKRR